MSASDCSKVGVRGSRGRRSAQGSHGGTITLRHGAVLLQNLTLEEARVLTADFCVTGGAARDFSPGSQGIGLIDADGHPETVLEDAQCQTAIGQYTCGLS